MRIASIPQIQQISPLEFGVFWHDHRKQHPDTAPAHLHVVDPQWHSGFDVFFNDADPVLLETNTRRAFYYGEIDHAAAWDVRSEDWDDLLYEIARIVLGSNVDTVQNNPEQFVGLPLWSLVAHIEVDAIFPPHLISVLNADFNNLASDRTDLDLEECFTNAYPNQRLGALYQKLRGLIHVLHVTQGTFCYEV